MPASLGATNSPAHRAYRARSGIKPQMQRNVYNECALLDRTREWRSPSSPVSSIRSTKPCFPRSGAFRWNHHGHFRFALSRLAPRPPRVGAGRGGPGYQPPPGPSLLSVRPAGEEACPRVIRRLRHRPSRPTKKSPSQDGAFKEEERLKIRQPHKSTRRNGFGAIPSVSGRAFQGSAA